MPDINLDLSRLEGFDYFGWPVHPAAEAFPYVPDEDLVALAEDIAVNGLRDPIVLTGGWSADTGPDPKKIHDGPRIEEEILVDGRNRARALCVLGLTRADLVHLEHYRTSYFNDDAHICAYVKSLNLSRRHLTTGQRALAGARLLKAGLVAQMPPGGKGRDVAAAEVKVSARSIQNAITIVEHGCPDLVRLVEQDGVKVTPAASVARFLSPAQQQEVLSERGVWGNQSRQDAIVSAAARLSDLTGLKVGDAVRCRKPVAAARGAARMWSGVVATIDTPERGQVEIELEDGRLITVRRDLLAFLPAPTSAPIQGQLTPAAAQITPAAVRAGEEATASAPPAQQEIVQEAPPCDPEVRAHPEVKVGDLVFVDLWQPRPSAPRMVWAEVVRIGEATGRIQAVVQPGRPLMAERLEVVWCEPTDQIEVAQQIPSPRLGARVRIKTHGDMKGLPPIGSTGTIIKAFAHSLGVQVLLDRPHTHEHLSVSRLILVEGVLEDIKDIVDNDDNDCDDDNDAFPQWDRCPEHGITGYRHCPLCPSEYTPGLGAGGDNNNDGDNADNDCDNGDNGDNDSQALSDWLERGPQEEDARLVAAEAVAVLQLLEVIADRLTHRWEQRVATRDSESAAQICGQVAGVTRQLAELVGRASGKLEAWLSEGRVEGLSADAQAVAEHRAALELGRLAAGAQMEQLRSQIKRAAGTLSRLRLLDPTVAQLDLEASS